ncbi:MAG: hypothetical protein IPF92_09335 [Myxococcales bacterium]|nr:hypothetical protein [Myxococcales bacterium]
MKSAAFLAACLSLAALASCSEAASDGGPEPVTHRSDITPVTRVEDALPGVFIPPFLDCRPPLAGESAGPDGKVCTAVSIAGATQPEKSFSQYASCDVVRTQRPYYPREPAKVPSASDPRLKDAAFMGELAWAKSQIAATGCACCHDSRITPRGPAQWDIAAEPLWLDTLSDTGLALFAGLADSSVLGAYPAAANHGFDRSATGIPTTDTPRMKRFVDAELARRRIPEAQARAVPPFGGPIYENSVRPATACGPGEGVEPQGRVLFKGGTARYVYVLEAGSKNPGVPPNLDRPQGTVWRLDVLPSAEALESGLRYGTTPAGSYQDTPSEGFAPSLVKGKTYQLTALRDVGLPTTSCLFVFGEPLGTAAPAPSPSGGAASGSFGATCTDSTGCSGAASYCALMPGRSSGYCTATGCKANPSVCPEKWGCLDLSSFQPGAPPICTKP